jgi:SAM-dependent methyltransferase
MLGLARLAEPVQRVCEIGPGSGRYAEKVIAAVHPKVYEIYETATDWLPHLKTLPGAVIQPCDGRTLASTPSASLDLVHAQKAFVYLDFATTVGYFREMARVVRPGGVVAFDIVSERCLDEEILDMWVNVGHTI